MQIEPGTQYLIDSLKRRIVSLEHDKVELESECARALSMVDMALPGLPGWARDAQLTKTEGKFLQLLLKHKGKMVHSERAMEYLYADRPDDPPERQMVDVYIHKLRKKLKQAPIVIETIWGEGYMLKLLGDMDSVDERAAKLWEHVHVNKFTKTRDAQFIQILATNLGRSMTCREIGALMTTSREGNADARAKNAAWKARMILEGSPWTIEHRPRLGYRLVESEKLTIGELEAANLPKWQRRVIKILLDNEGRWVGRQAFAAHGVSPSNVSMVCHQARPKIAPLGWAVETGRSAKAKGYRLIRRAA